MKKVKIILFLFLFLSTFANCSSMVSTVTSSVEQNVSYLDALSVGIFDIVMTSEDETLNKIKKSVIDYILQHLPEVEKMSFPERLLIVNRDKSGLIYNIDAAFGNSNTLLSGELEGKKDTGSEEGEGTSGKDDGKNNENTSGKDDGENEGKNNENTSGKDDGENEGKNNENTSGKDNNQNDSTSGNTQEKDFETIIDITNSIQNFMFDTFDESSYTSNINPLLGKDVGTIAKENKSTYKLTMPETILSTPKLSSKDFDNDIILISKAMDVPNNIVIAIFMQIKEKVISTKIIVINNVLNEILSKMEFSIDKKDYEEGNIEIEPLVWNNLKLIFLGNNVASLKVKSNIDNALVYIDDKYVGRTKEINESDFLFRIDVIASGSHKIKIIKNGYRTIEGYIYLEKNKVSILIFNMELLKSDSSIILYLNEGSADVWLDMNYIGTTSEDKNTPFVIECVQEGVHKIRVEKKDFNPFVEKVTLDGISDEKIKVELKKYNANDFDPDYRSSPYRYCSDIFIYSTLLSFIGTVGLFFEFQTLQDALDGYGNSVVYKASKEDIGYNLNQVGIWKDTFSYLTILLVIGSITFKWIELEQRNIQIGDSGFITVPTISMSNNYSLTIGINLGYYF